MSAPKPPSKSAPASPEPGLSEDDWLLFEREFADVRPLRRGSERIVPDFHVPEEQSRAASVKPRRKAVSAQRLVVDRQEGRVTGASFGVSHLILRALSRGEIRPEASCDLHGLRAESARRKVQNLVEESAAAGRRAVLVVFGRGRHSGPEGPVLREVVIDSLCRAPLLARVLAFSSAARADGGDGAIVILLRRRAE